MDVKRLNHFSDDGFEVIDLEDLPKRLEEKTEKPVTASAEKPEGIRSFVINKDPEQEL